MLNVNDHIPFPILGVLYVSDKEGNDEDADGTEEKPFKTPLNALMFFGKEPFPTIYVDSHTEGEVHLN